ncbi:MAG: YfcE family phosphodiesterase [Oscillospiraceae bacterium]|nr:YfcE family phosphodiesterase [Oscillospiraceae bacterium]
MRILVISDSHGNFFKFKDVMEKHRDAELVFFLGDGKREYEDICDLFPERKILAVKGNCDFISPLPSVNTVGSEQGKILYTHGDVFNVKFGTQRLEEAAVKEGARLVLYGHTHKRDARYLNGMYIFNPGSLGSDGSYGICDILDSGIAMNHLNI